MEKRTDRVGRGGGGRARSVVLPVAEISLRNRRQQGPHEFGLREMDPRRWIVVVDSAASRRAFVPRLALLMPRSGGNAMLILDVGSEAEIHGDRGERSARGSNRTT